MKTCRALHLTKFAYNWSLFCDIFKDSYYCLSRKLDTILQQRKNLILNNICHVRKIFYKGGQQLYDF